ncbi:NrfD/PsrC family molybdoenzyme membrane anchor subunit [Alcaligenes sp. SDU_A2]|uniref:NrfD/PsrC family molybdoenzyme membrane anchor subunit n=1 Tax=Alcaligenes sp. SDU_A2 TaxID=3136634 RepID=UPI00311E07F1
MTIIELLTPAYDVAWLPWAVQYFFLVGLAATSTIWVWRCAWSKDASLRALEPALMIVLLCSSVAAPISLLADLHQPGRFWHFYAHFTPWSWMSLGAVLLPVFVGLSLANVLAWWLDRRTLWRWLSLALLASAVSVLVYSGAEVLVLRSRPLWNTVFLPINFALTAALASLGAILLTARWLPGGMAALPVAALRRWSLGTVLALMICALLWVATGLLGHSRSFQAAAELFQIYPVWRLSFLGSMVFGLLILFLLSRPAKTLHGKSYSLLCAVLMLGSAWVFRWIIFMAVQGVPKYGAGLYLYTMPLGSDGLLGMLGVLGLCVALLMLSTTLLSYFPARRHAVAA